MRRLALIAAMLGLCVASALCAPCRDGRGTHITLFGGVDDPDVLVWDSKDRLIRFAGGSTDERSFLLPHALLNRPGTRAVIVSCEQGAVHPKFSGEDADAIGVLIVSGHFRGRYGWVSSSDVHSGQTGSERF